MEHENLSGCDYAEPEWAKENHRLLTEIGEVVDGIVADGKEHRERMARLRCNTATDGFCKST